MNERKLSANEEAEHTTLVTGIAAGRCTAWLEAYAERTGVPFALLSTRVAILIHRSASGEAPGLPQPMSSGRLQRQATAHQGTGSWLPSSDLDDDSSGKARKATARKHRRKLSLLARRRIGKAQRERWKRAKLSKRKSPKRLNNSTKSVQARMWYRAHKGKNPQLRKQAQLWLQRQEKAAA